MREGPRWERTVKHRLAILLPTLAGLLLAIVGAIVGTAAQAAPQAAFDSAYAQFSRAAGGETAAIRPAAEAFESLLQAEPANPLLLAYAGASTAMRAVTAMAPMDKLAFAEDGLAQLDKSLALLTPSQDRTLQRGVPESIEVRFVAANTFLAVPPFMNRAARGSKLLNEVLGSPLFATAPLPFKGAVWLRAAALAKQEQRPADARRFLEAVVAQGAPQAAQAQARLKELAP
jgi:hypothetical protein